MLCPQCGNNTAADKKYCEFCGNALDLDFDNVEEALLEEIEGDLEAETEERFRGYLFIALFVLLAVIAFKIVLPDPIPIRGLAPAYVPVKEPGPESDTKEFGAIWDSRARHELPSKEQLTITHDHRAE